MDEEGNKVESEKFKIITNNKLMNKKHSHLIDGFNEFI